MKIITFKQLKEIVDNSQVGVISKNNKLEILVPIYPPTKDETKIYFKVDGPEWILIEKHLNKEIVLFSDEKSTSVVVSTDKTHKKVIEFYQPTKTT